MRSEIEPDVRQDAGADECNIKTCGFGSSANVVFCANGGSGLPCDYLRETHLCLAAERYRVVASRGLRIGASDRLIDPALWTIERYV